MNKFLFNFLKEGTVKLFACIIPKVPLAKFGPRFA